MAESEKLYAFVATFSGLKMIEIESVWCFEGRPERIQGKDEQGQSFKFKYDEEPFQLFYAEQNGNKS